MFERSLRHYDIHLLKSESEVSQSCPTLCDPRTVAHQAPPSMGFSRQEYWSGLPFPSPGDLPDAGIEPGSPTLQAGALTSAPPGKPKAHCYYLQKSAPTLGTYSPTNYQKVMVALFYSNRIVCHFWKQYTFPYSVA